MATIYVKKWLCVSFKENFANYMLPYILLWILFTKGPKAAWVRLKKFFGPRESDKWIIKDEPPTLANEWANKEK